MRRPAAPASALSQIDLDTIAGEIMWDAILASVPQEPPLVTPQPVTVLEDKLRAYAGFYDFGPHARLKVAEDKDALSVTAMRGNVFEFPIGTPVTMSPVSDTEFAVNARYQTRLSFTLGPDGRATGAILKSRSMGSNRPARARRVRVDSARRFEVQVKLADRK